MCETLRQVLWKHTADNTQVLFVPPPPRHIQDEAVGKEQLTYASGSTRRNTAKCLHEVTNRKMGEWEDVVNPG
jgi:hypothetical protein